MREAVAKGAGNKWEVIECGRDGGEGEDVTARADDNWPTDEKQMDTDKKI